MISGEEEQQHQQQKKRKLMEQEEEEEEEEVVVVVHISGGTTILHRYDSDCDTLTVVQLLTNRYGPGDLQNAKNGRFVGTSKIQSGRYDYHINVNNTEQQQQQTLLLPLPLQQQQQTQQQLLLPQQTLPLLPLQTITTTKDNESDNGNIIIKFLNGPNSSFLINVTRDCFIEDIKSKWSITISCGYQHAIIMVRWYATTGLLRCYRLDDLVKSFPFIPTHIESYLLFHVKVYPYGRGIPTLKGKKVLIETDIASYERLSDSKLADIDCCFDDQEGGGGGGGGGGGSYHIVRNNRRYPISLPIRIDDNNVLDICNAKWYFNTFYALFCLPKHANYDNLNFHQLHEISSIVYQQHEEDSEEDIIRFTSLMKSIPSGHHARLTATAVAAAGGGGGKDRLTSPIDRVWKLINSTSKSLEVFHHAKLVLKEVLEYTSNNMMPKVEYSEQTRRTVIDYVVFTAMKIANHLLFVSMEKEEGEEVVVEEEEEEPRCRRVLLVDEESLVNEEDPTLLPLDREELIGSGGSLDYALFPEGVIIVRQSGDEGEQRNIVDDEEEYEEEEEEKEKYPFYVEETTFNLDDCGLCQLLGQIHDTMYVKVDNNNTEEQQQVYQQQQVLQQQQQQHSQKGLKRKLDGERVAGSVYSHVKVSRDKVIGILTTGHRVEVFSIRAHPATSTTTTSTTTTASTATATLQKKKKKIVEFHGRRTLKVLRYLLQSSQHISSFKVRDHTVKIEIDDVQLQEMLLLFIAVFMKYV